MSPTRALVEAHTQAGRTLRVGGVRTFVREEGQGTPVLCMHGVPVSSFLYRKVLPELARRGLRGICFDLPGLGLSQRSPDLDPTWTGLGRFAVEAVDALALDRFHLVVHDIGGPVGFELAATIPERIASLTIMNTMVEVTRFRKPWAMAPLAVPVLGELWLAAMVGPVFTTAMYMLGVSDRRVCPPEQVLGHLRLLKRDDRGRAFLRIMRAFETTEAKEALYLGTLREAPYPIQALWGDLDPGLRIEVQGEEVRRIVGTEAFSRVPAKHFLQETHPVEVAELVAALVTRVEAGDA